MRFEVSMICILLSGCNWVTPEFESRESAAQPAIALTSAEEDGKVTGTASASATLTQRLAASSNSSIAGASVAIPPGALAIDANISLEEGSAIANAETSASLGITDNDVSSASQPVLVSADADISLASPMTLAIPLGSALHLAGGQLVVFKHVFNKTKGSNYKGVILNPPLSKDQTMIELPITEFGSYQAAYLAKPIEKAPEDRQTVEGVKNKKGVAVAPTASKEATAIAENSETADDTTADKEEQDKIDETQTTTAASQSSSADDEPDELGAFSINTFSLHTNVADPMFAWTASDHATSYDLRITSDAGCDNIIKEVTTTQLSADIGPLAEGNYYVCILAENGDMHRTADNNGSPIVIDMTAPAAPDITSPSGPTNVAPLIYDLTLSEKYAPVDLSKLTLSHGTATVTEVDDTHLTISVMPPTNAGEINITLQTNDAITDLAGNAFPSVVTTAITFDNTPPQIQQATTLDRNNNGFIDGYEIVFDEPVNDNSMDGYNGSGPGTDISTIWQIEGRSNVRFEGDIGTPNDNTIVLSFDESAYMDTGEVPDLTASGSSLADNVGNQIYPITTGMVTETDGVGPQLIAAKARPFSNQLRLYFSEPVYETAGHSDFSSTPFVTYTDNSANGVSSASVLADAKGADGVVVLETGVPFTASDFGQDEVAVTAPYFDYSGNSGIANTLTLAQQFGADVNGDGYDDLIIGEPKWDNGTNLNAGRVTLYWGSPSFASASTDQHQVQIKGGIAGEEFGEAIATHGDLNLDGLDDIAIGVPKAQGGKGAVHVFYGRRDWESYYSASQADFIESGASAGNSLGRAVVMGRDVTGDAHDDLAISGSDTFRTVNIYAGSSTNPVFFTSRTGGANTYGASLAFVPSFEGNTNALLVAAPNPGEVEVLKYDGASGVTSIISTSASAQTSARVAYGGDLDGDGYADALIGSPEYMTQTGDTHIFYGSSGALNASTTAFGSGTTGERRGDAVANIGDIDSNNYSNFVIGSPGFGSGSVEVNGFDGTNIVTNKTIPGMGTGDAFGQFIAQSTDINGDGNPDLIVSAPGYDGGSGKVFIFDGSAVLSASDAGSATFYITATQTGAGLGVLP